MEKNELRARLIAVAKELDKLEVRGSANMGIVLGCQNYLNKLADEVMAEEE